MTVSWFINHHNGIINHEWSWNFVLAQVMVGVQTFQRISNEARDGGYEDTGREHSSDSNCIW
jgi:hypothetical protein